jgi:cbb3-type cytochrome oxidase maturation protein
MNGLVVLIPVALFLGAVGLVAFLWAIKSNQFDDLDGAAVRILEDDDGPIGEPERDAGLSGQALTPLRGANARRR